MFVEAFQEYELALDDVSIELLREISTLKNHSNIPSMEYKESVYVSEDELIK